MLKDYTRWMFDDVGNKIKGVAVATTWVGIFLSILEGIITFFLGIFYLDTLGYLILVGPISAVLGCIAAWLCSLTLYGFGQLIVNTEPVKPSEPSPLKTAPLVNKPAFKPATTNAAHSWRCNTCGRMINQTPCPFCTDAEPKEVVQDELNWVCPRCGKKNPKDRSACWGCGFKK